MKYYKFYLVFICICFCSCQSHMPFTSNKEKMDNFNLIKKRINLSKFELKKIKNNDSVLYEVSMAIKDTVELRNIKRRLDSFFVKRYDKEQLITMLQLERLKTGWDFELDREKKFIQYLEFDSISQIKEFLKDFEKNLQINFKSTIIKEE